MSRILIIQTAFIGDVVLATPLIENIAKEFPEAKIDFVLRKGNKNLLEGHPYIHKLFIWDKKGGKYKKLIKLIKEVRAVKYDYAFNLQRFASTGIITLFTKAKRKIGFKKNPLSLFYTDKVAHNFEKGVHEVDRNLSLLKGMANITIRNPKLYPSQHDFDMAKSLTEAPYVCLAPASVWFTKQLPKEKWVELCKLLSGNYHVCFLGAPGDSRLSEDIAGEAGLKEYTNLCGKLSFLQSAALMQAAGMNYVNDSAPLHFASSVNAKTVAFFCSTIPEFGFGPLSAFSKIAQVEEKLDCRPCGLHGKRQCPKGHFDCGYKIKVEKFLPNNE